MKVRSRLYLLVAAALTPMAIFAVAAVLLLQQNERQTVEREAIGRARSAMSAVDAHLRGSILSLQMLAASRNLESGDLAAFHAESQRVLRAQPNWVNVSLTSASRIQLFNAVYAFGKPEPLSPVDESFDAVLRTAKPSIGSVMAGIAVRNPTVRVRIPIVRNGQVRYVMAAPMNLKSFAELLQAQRLPEGWAIALVDRNGQSIAGVPAAVTGTPLPDSFRAAIEGSREGWFHGGSAEGRPTYTAHVISDLSGWVLAITIPESYVGAGGQRSFALLAVGALLALVLGIAAASLIARRISP